MNPDFLPNPQEQALIQTVQKYCRNEFALIRMTETMLKKSIIDASDPIRILLRDGGIIDYSKINQGEKLTRSVIVLAANQTTERDTSFYRPKTKSGDPRFWVSRFKDYVSDGELVYFTILDNQLIAIPLIKPDSFETLMESLFGSIDDGKEHLSALANLLQGIRGQWIPSISPYKSVPRAIGETLETVLGLEINNLASADFKGEIEIKTKKRGGKTSDTLFSKVPDWSISPISSAADMMLKYGYPSTRYPGFIDLYVTVNHRPNNQGLYMEDDPVNEHMLQVHTDDGTVCKWKHQILKDTLLAKHPKTIWVTAQQQIINDIWHFQYDIDSIQLTERPIFAQFLTLISQGIITYDWRGRVMPDRTKYKDKGHCFRIKPKERQRLFGTMRKLSEQ